MKRVLVVDDSLFQRRRIAEMVSSAGHEVAQASNGRRALEFLEQESVDLVLLDLLMPDLDGFGVLEELKHRPGAPPVVVCSADIQESAQERCAELGARRFLHKPPKQEELTLALRDVLEGTA